MHPHIHARNMPDKAAYIMATSGETVTYAQLDARSNQIAHLIRATGLKRGDAIGICMENNVHYFEICWAAQRAGLYFTCISSRLTASEVAYILGDCNAKIFFASDYLSDMAAELKTLMPDLKGYFITGKAIDGYTSYVEARNAHPETPIDDESRGLDMLYSSGTTGRPKGIRRPLPDGAIEDTDALILLVQGLYSLSLIHI